MAEQGPIVFCTGGGCTAKLGAGVLSRILEKHRKTECKDQKAGEDAQFHLR